MLIWVQLIGINYFTEFCCFLMVDFLVAFLAGLGAIFFEIPGLSLAVSDMFVLLMSGLILYEISNIIHAGKTNYIMATVTLFVSIFNLFTSLLHLLGFMNGEQFQSSKIRNWGNPSISSLGHMRNYLKDYMLNNIDIYEE